MICETGSLDYADHTIFTFVHESRVFDQETSSNRTCKPFSSLRWLVWWRRSSRRLWKSFKYFENAWTTLRATVWSILYQTRLANVSSCHGVAAWQCRTFFMRRCRLPATAGRAFSRCHGAAPIGIMISMMTRHGKYGKAWKAVEPGKKDHGAAQGALLVSWWSCLAGNQHVQIQPLNPNCLRASSIRGQPTALPLLPPKHKKDNEREIRLTQNHGQKILASHLPAMPRKTLFSFAPLLGFVRFQGLRSCNAYNLWFRMPAAKSNRPTCLRWIPQRSCWRFLTCSKRWNDAVVALHVPLLVTTSTKSRTCERLKRRFNAWRSPRQSFGGKLRGTNGIHIRILPSVCWIVDAGRCQQCWQRPGDWATMSFSRPPMAAFLGQKGIRKVCLLNVCVFHGCMLVLQYMQHSEMGSYGLSVCFQSRYFKSLMKSHEISLSLMVQWLPESRVEVWESYLNIPETDPRHVSRHVVGFEALVLATHDMGPVCYSMSQYVTVWSCAVPMWRLYAIVLSEMRRLNLDYMDKETWEAFLDGLLCASQWLQILMSHDEPPLSVLMSSHASYDEDEFQIPQRIKSHLTMEDAMCVDPSEKDGALGRLNGWLVKSSHWHLTSCHLGPSWIPTYFSASGLAVEVFPQACSKKRVSFSNQRGSLESFAWVLHSLWWSLSQLLLVMGDLKLYFGGRFVV